MFPFGIVTDSNNLSRSLFFHPVWFYPNQLFITDIKQYKTHVFQEYDGR